MIDAPLWSWQWFLTGIGLLIYGGFMLWVGYGWGRYDEWKLHRRLEHFGAPDRFHRL